MASQEVAQPPAPAASVLPAPEQEVEEDLKAAVKGAIPAADETDEQILFSCNICYDVSGARCDRAARANCAPDRPPCNSLTARSRAPLTLPPLTPPLPPP
jgi:hypothetical protein